MRRAIYITIIFLLLDPVLAGLVGNAIGPGTLRPARLNPERLQHEMFRQIKASGEDFVLQTPRQCRVTRVEGSPGQTKWRLGASLHGVSDNRTGMLGAADLLLRHGLSVVMMDSRAHGTSGGDMATYGWKERYDTVSIANELYASEKVRHLFALGVSMGAAIALQSAAVEPRIEGVVAEDPFADLREVSYDYAGLRMWPLLGKTYFRPASVFAMRSMSEAGGFNPDDVSPVKAVAERPFAVLLICGTRDNTIPCRHTERIYAAATGPKELWIVPGAFHASALGQDPAEYEKRAVSFFEHVGARK
jgi:alpha-beta hydrolase superfamily lysophospholipase